MPKSRWTGPRYSSYRSASQSQPQQKKSKKKKNASVNLGRGDLWGSTMRQLTDLSGVLEEDDEPVLVDDERDTVADPEDEYFGTVRSDIVGVQYYHGTVSNNEMVNLVREPTNKYDRNAVRVDNVTNEQVGHIKREYAKALSQVVDSSLAKIEGIIPFGANNKFRIPVTISLWGAPDKKAAALAVLKSHSILVDSTTPLKKAASAPGLGSGASYAALGRADYGHVVSERTFVSPREMENAMDQMFATLDEGDKTTEANPVQGIKTGLYPHQKQALNWMLCRENKCPLPPFWEKKGDTYINTLTMCHTRIRPASVCGGILADDMGLGKTLQIISLVLTNFVDDRPLAWPLPGTRRRPLGATGKSSAKDMPNKSDCSGASTSNTKRRPTCDKVRTLESPSSTPATPKLNLGEKSSDQAVSNKTAQVQQAQAISTPPTAPRINLTSLVKEEGKASITLSPIVKKELIIAKTVAPSDEKAAKKKDPDFVPDASEHSSLSVAPPARGRRERKRPARYCYTDDEEDEEEGDEVKSKRAKKKGKGVGKKSKPLAVADSNKDDTNMSRSIQDITAETKMSLPAFSEVATEMNVIKVPEDIKENAAFAVCPAELVNLTPSELSSGPLVLTSEPKQTSGETGVVKESASPPSPSKSVMDKQEISTQNMELPLAACDVRENDSKDIVESADAGQNAITDVDGSKEIITIGMSADVAVTEKTCLSRTGKEATIIIPNDVIGTGKEATIIIPNDVIGTGKEATIVIPNDVIGTGKEATKIIPNDVIIIEEDHIGEPIANVSNIKCSTTVAGSSPGPTGLKNPFLKNLLVKENTKPVAASPTPTPSAQDAVYVLDSDDDLPDIPPVKPTAAVKPAIQSVKLSSDYDATTGRAKTSGPRGTLIICPLSVISNWVNQFEEHLHESVHICLHVYYGSARKKDVRMLKEQDVVITTYSTLAADCKNMKQSPLHQVEWLRLVLDEGHIIRNPRSQQAKAVYQLNGRRKWVITGTPIQNSMKDLWSLINFLGVKPFTDKTWWNRTIARPLAQRESKAIQRVSHLMRNLALRRTKTQQLNGKPLITLPARHVFLEKITLGEEERRVYDAMQENGRVIIGRYFRQGTLLHHYGEVLAILTRLRQLCCHPQLVANAVNKMLENNPGAALLEAPAAAAAADQPQQANPAVEPALVEEERQRLITQLLYVLGSGSDQECAICLESLRRGVITACAHVYCRPCIEAVIDNEQPSPKCPLCRAGLQKNQLIEAPAEEQRKEGDADDGEAVVAEEEERNWPTPEAWESSAKIDALMRGLTELRDRDPKIKSIVVSQFTSLLDLIEIPLGMQGFEFARLDGRMSASERTRAVEEFSSETCGAPTVFLLSLKAGGVGINLTAASRVFLMDPAWNPASEEQCFDRCHRLGQTKEVVITRFVIEDSVEERMLELQEKKRQLMKGAFGRSQTRDERRTNLVNMIRNLIRI